MGDDISHKVSPCRTAQAAPEVSPNELWTKPRPQKTPAPTYAPAVIALAIVCLLWGLLTTWLISLLGLVLLGIGLADWIGALLNERE